MKPLRLADRVRAARARKVPAGWLTLEQLARADGRTNARGNFYYVAQDAVTAGILRKKTFVIECGNGLRTTAHYRPVK